MKKNIFMIITFLLLSILLSGCIVDRTKALVTFYNQTEDPLSNIKIGDAVYCGFLYGGQKRDIWIYTEGSGIPEADECQAFEVEYKGKNYNTVKIRFDWTYTFRVYAQNRKKYIEWTALKTGYDLSDDGLYYASDLYQ